MNALTFVFFVALIRGSGEVATNMYCRLANNRCATLATSTQDPAASAANAREAWV